MSKLFALLTVCLIACCGCRGTVEYDQSPLLAESIVLHANAEFGPSYGNVAAELQTSLQKIVDGNSNPGRQRAIRERLGEWQISFRSEWIDWNQPMQENIIVDFPGETDRWIYIVAHSDKCDGTLYGSFAGQLTSGITDNLTSYAYLSDGAVDNGVGCATLLQIAKHLNGKKMKHSYRLCFFGGEEVGLRGSRCFVAGLSSEEWDKIDIVFNLDMFGASEDHGVIFSSSEVGNYLDHLLDKKRHTLNHVIRLTNTNLFPLATSDHASFRTTNMPLDMMFGCIIHALGGIIPSRSWFTWHKSSRHTVFLLSQPPNDHMSFCIACNLAMLPISEIHGYRDSATKIHWRGQLQSYICMENYLKIIDGEFGFHLLD